MTTRKISRTFMLAVGMLLVCTLPLTAQDSLPKPTVNTAVASGVTPPLSELMKLPQPAQYGFQQAPPLRLIPKQDFGTSVDPVEQRGAAPASNYTIVANFLGVGNGFPGYTVSDAPPDTNMAVGDTQILQWVNVSYTICSKTSPYTCGPAIIGNALWQTLPPGSLCLGNAGDIIAQFDRQAHRWFLAHNIFVSPYAVCVAISDTANALGTWHVWQFPVPGAGFPDYPKWGIWPTGGVNSGYYQAMNNFGPGGGAFVGPQICAYDRSAMLAGAPAPEQICYQLTPSEDSLLPGDLDSINGPPNTSAGTPQDEFYIGSVGDVNNSHLSLYQFHADFAVPANSFVLGSPNTILQPVPTYAGSCGGAFGGDCVPQGGISDKLDSLGDRLMYRFAYWNEGCALCYQHWYVNHDVEVSGAQIGVRWYEFQAPTAGIGTLTSTSLTTYQAGTYAPDSNYRWMGSLTQDSAGDILVGYSESSSTSHPAIYVAGRTLNDPIGLNNLESELLVVQGNGSQPDTSNRWGDYSAMRIDPDGCTFWYTSEYYMVTQPFDWSTQIASIKFANCQGSPPPDGCTEYCDAIPSSNHSNRSACVELPPGAEIGPYEDLVDGPVNLLYPGVNTSTDDWYVDNPTLFPCPSVGGTAPPRDDPTIPGVPDPAAVNAEVERLAAQLPGFLHFSGPFLPIVPPNYVYPEPELKKTSCEDRGGAAVGFYGLHLEFCKALAKSPFHGKDIIYVHGFSTDVLEGVLFGNPYPTWPDDPSLPPRYAPYWQPLANQYWDDPNSALSHIHNFLIYRNGIFRNAQNRYITVGWSSAQGLETDANAILKQIADAMRFGDGVKLANPADPRKDPLTGKAVGFCVAGCIVISHSTGGPLTDVAMSFAADPVYQQGAGPIGFIPKHIMVHAALAGAISGSQLATAGMVVAFALTNDPAVCDVASLLLFHHTGSCASFYKIKDSVLWDLVPQVMQANWSSRINDTPVPVLTVAGASDHLYWPLKFFFARGFDDGVVTMDSACGRPVPIWEWPSGFSDAPLGSNRFDPRLYDKGMPSANHPGRYFLEQNYEYLWSFPPFDAIPRAAGGCAPSKTPWGMLEPIFPYFRIFNPLNYYHNHYSFVQTGEDHYDIVERTDALRWDSRAVLDASIYTTNPGGIALGLVRDNLKTAQVQVHRGRPVRFLGHRLGWIWKRTYHLLNGIDGLSTDDMAAADYVYDYVN